MIEKAKTVLLTLLVMLSLFQSYVLAYHTPAYDTIAPTNYLKPFELGSKFEYDEIIQPRAMVFHYGQEGHVVTYPTTTYFRIMLDALGEAKMSNPVGVELSDMDWKNIYEKYPAVELQFKDALPLDMWNDLVPIRDGYGTTASFNRLIVYQDLASKQMVALLISDQNKFVSKSSVDMDATKFEKYMSLGRFQPKYAMIRTTAQNAPWNGLYLPENPLAVVQYQLFYQPFTVNEIKSALFVDPSITRQIHERDGSLIFTDGSRGLQIRPESMRITFNVPTPPSEKLKEHQPKEELNTAIQFINQHGGWNGHFLLESMPSASNGAEVFQFRQYYGPYPIVDSDSISIGLVETRITDGVVATYGRSLISMDRVIKKKESTTGDQKSLLEQFKQRYLSTKDMEEIRLAYQATAKQDIIELNPVWIVELKNGKTVLIPAMQEAGEKDGLK